jgi:hypothetical protein
VVYEISRFAPHKTAKVAAAIYGLISIGIVPIVWLATLAAPGGFGLSGLFFLALPLLYAGFGYVFTAVGCMTYNWVVKHIGGIEVELDAESVG